MKERPILFSGAMVRALLDGSKTQTRRVMKKQPYISRTSPPNFSDVEVGDLFICPDYCPTTPVRNSVIAECESLGTYHCMGQSTFAEKHSPYGVPGDRLWVRETWVEDPEDDGTWHYTQYMGCKGSPLSDIPRKFQKPEHCIYREGWDGREMVWRPSIHMPRWASRILLEITGVRVERLQEITQEDSIAEGIEFSRASFMPQGFRLYDQTEKAFCTSPIESYRSLWDSLRPPTGSMWADNPWVWVVEFKRVEK